MSMDEEKLQKLMLKSTVPVGHRMMKTMISSVAGVGTSVLVENIYDRLFLSKYIDEISNFRSKET